MSHDSDSDFDISDTEVNDLFEDEDEFLSPGDAAISTDNRLQKQPIFNEPSVLVNFRVGRGPTPICSYTRPGGFENTPENYLVEMLARVC